MGYFLGFVFLCALGTPECKRDNALQVVQIPGKFSWSVMGFAGIKCQEAAVQYAQAHFDPNKNRIGVNCELRSE